jgi:hypothetical protein
MKMMNSTMRLAKKVFILTSSKTPPSSLYARRMAGFFIQGCSDRSSFLKNKKAPRRFSSPCPLIHEGVLFFFALLFIMDI